MNRRAETAGEFLATRLQWLKVRRVPGEHDGQDIAIIIDGSYFDIADAERMTAYFRQRLAYALAAEPPATAPPLPRRLHPAATIHRPRDEEMTIEQVLARLDMVTPNGDKRWKARCPAHEDQAPSLSVRVGDRRPFLLYCHAGCSYEAILAAIIRPRAQAPS